MLLLISAMVLGIIGALFLSYMIWLAFHDVVTYETVYTKKIPEVFGTFRVFFIADIHRRKISMRTLEKITQGIDLVFIGGDLTERGASLQVMHDNILKLKKWQQPIYFVWGNNDYEAIPSKIERILVSEDVIIVTDSVTQYEKSGDSINLIGFDFKRGYTSRKTIDWLHINDDLTMLLTHTPDSFYALTEQQMDEIDIVFAGHTHGGQIRLLNRGFYSRGKMSQYRKTKVFVTEGYGYSVFPLRLQTNAQCHVITFKKNN